MILYIENFKKYILAELPIFLFLLKVDESVFLACNFAQN